MEIKITITICAVSMIAVLILCAILILRYKRDQEKRTGEQNMEVAESLVLCPDWDTEQHRLQTAPILSVRIGKVHGIGKREDQQDTLAYSDVEDETTIRQNGILLIVADGMGGLELGAETSSLASVEMLRYFDVHPMMERPAEALKDALLYANGKVTAFLGEQRIGMSGSTLAAALIQNHNVYWISVGDSSIFLYHEKRIRRLNELHDYETELQRRVERGELTAEEAARHPQRGALTSFIGQRAPALIERNTQALVLSAGDRLILATDGICKTVGVAQLEGLMQFEAGVSAQKLQYFIEAESKKNQDNYTAFIIEKL
ncbi:MAG: protein phosphatase 2C domain-containing protein [bacterium]|nr:protein phosphatase 2C domain-containing protein [bacterium]